MGLNQTKPPFHQRFCGLKCTENKKITSNWISLQNTIFLFLWQTAMLHVCEGYDNSNTATKPTIFLPTYIISVLLYNKKKNKKKQAAFRKHATTKFQHFFNYSTSAISAKCKQYLTRLVSLNCLRWKWYFGVIWLLLGSLPLSNNSSKSSRNLIKPYQMWAFL